MYIVVCFTSLISSYKIYNTSIVSVWRSDVFVSFVELFVCLLTHWHKMAIVRQADSQADRQRETDRQAGRQRQP